jgi:hypothetical protein
MTKATLEFNIDEPDEAYDHKLALKGREFVSLIMAFDNFFRREEIEDMTGEEVKEKFYEVLNDQMPDWMETLHG